MPHPNRLARGLFSITLLLGLIFGLVGPSLIRAQAAPKRQTAVTVIISEFRTRGANGGLDEFVEIFNPTDLPITVGNWELRALNSSGIEINIATIPSGTALNSKQHYLFANTSTNGYDAPVTPDQPYSTGIVDEGGIAIYSDTGVRIDSVGTTANSPYAEGNPLPPFIFDFNQSYERVYNPTFNCVDSGNNAGDFVVRKPSDPQNMASPIDTCGDPAPYTTQTATAVTATAAVNGTNTAIKSLTGTSAANLTATAILWTPTLTGTLQTPTITPTPHPTLQVVINEIAWMGTPSSRSDQWIELYNPNQTTPVDITGWKLASTDNAVVILLSGIIPKNGYFIIANPNTFSVLHIDQIYTFNLGVTGKVLKLTDVSGVVVDTVNSNGGAWPAGVPCSNNLTPVPIPTPIINTCASMERHSAGWNDSDWFTFGGTGSVLDRTDMVIRGTPGAINWALTVTATPTRGATPTRTPIKTSVVIPTAAPILVINEFLPRAGFDWNRDGKVDVFDEFIEVANLGPINVNLAGWKLDDEAGKGSNPYILPSITLKPGEHKVFYGSQTNIHLSDGGDTVRLLNPNNVIKDAKSYSVVTVADQSTCRLPDINGSWYSDCFPTPNQRNTHTGQVPAAAPGTGLEAPVCLLPDTLPDDFRFAECFGYGTDMWQSAYWDKLGWWQGDHSVPQNGSKWETFIE